MEEPTYCDFFDDSTTLNSPGSTNATPQPEQSGKKKRKAWGQPIPDFKVVLPPRKRAKTVEEKEQRKNERVIRNRKAADKSRQRQKAAVAELEVKTGLMEAELAQLRAALTQYQSTFGILPGTSPLDIPDTSLEPSQVPSPPVHVDYSSIQSPPATSTTPSNNDCSKLSLSYPSPDDTTSFTATPGPTLSHDSPPPSPCTTQSPPLAPSIFSSQDLPSFSNLAEDDSITYTNFNEVSGLTQYPAAILCDPQCQPETTLNTFNSQRATRQVNLSLYLINLTFLMTVYKRFSTSMLLPMCQMFQTLAESLSTNSFTPDWMDHHFHLIHSLITTGSSKTTQPTFRMKLLSRLLASSPSTARLLKAATDRALQRLVDEEAILHERPGGGRRWASLLATKWAMQRLEKEHQRYRLVVDGPRYSTDQPVPELVRQMGLINKMEGVDYLAVERSLWRWRSDNGMVGAIAPDVH